MNGSADIPKTEKGGIERMRDWESRYSSYGQVRELPEYLELIGKVQAEQEQLHSDISDIYSKIGRLAQESKLGKIRLTELLELPYIVRDQHKELEEIKQKLSQISSPVIFRWDFLLAVCILIAGIVFMVAGVFTNSVGYVITGIVSLFVAVLHLSSLGR